VLFEVKLKTGGRTSRDEAVLVHSFGVELPVMCGTESASSVSRDGRLLPACPTVNEWDTGGGIRGAKFNLARNLRKIEYIRTRIANELAGEASEVARQMLDDSVRFLQKLSSSISTHYHEVRTRSGTSDKECWELILHCVRTVFSVLGRPASARSQKERRRLCFFGGHSKLTVSCERCSLMASRPTQN
jgi:hypothetical protein